MNKKAKLNQAMIGGVVFSIVALVVLFVVLSVLIPEAQTAGDTMNDSNRCDSVGCFYNSSATPTCSFNSTLQTTACGNNANTIPLSSLFASSGVVFVIVMAIMLIIIIGAFLKKKK